jgi:glutaconate CoA-transferase, subunit A
LTTASTPAAAAAASKLTDMASAIAAHVHDGDLVYLTGWTQLEPHSAVHEIIRQRRKDLVLARANVNLLLDQAVAAGVARKLIFSYAGIAGVGLLGPTRRAIEEGRIEWEEYTHYQLLARLQAGASGLPFFPIRSGAGSDLARVNPALKTVQCPYTGETLVTVPPLRPDVTIVHAQRADVHGNLQIWGVLGDIREAVFASRRVIATVEEIVDESVIRSDPNRTIVPGFAVSAVVRSPWGAHPSFAQGYYDRDNPMYIDWSEVCRDRASVDAYLRKWVYDIPDRDAYMRMLSAERLLRLQVRPYYSVPVNFGRND